MVKIIRRLFQNKQSYLLIAIACVMVMVTAFVGVADSSENRMLYTESNEVLPANPNIGYAPQASYNTLDEDISLVYLGLTWAELEPQEGVFNWTEIERKYNLNRWREEGKHVVLRFILDYPREEKHIDIPRWMYDKIGGDGDYYDMSSGKGFSPNYNHPTLINYHKRAIEAMGARWGQDGFVSFIQLGSLGHWGEWHINHSEGLIRMPKADVREQYITPYMSAFPHARILMRRPFRAATTFGFGVFNDMVGDKASTDEWLGWLKNGGDYTQAEEENELVAMPNWWENAPVGGEFTSRVDMKNLLIRNLNRTLGMVKDSHMTFIGPKFADIFGSDRNGYDRIRKHLGYRIWVSRVEIDSTDRSKLRITWNNTGVAPMYHKWNTYLYIEDASGTNLATVTVPIDFTTLQPNTSQTVVVQAPMELNPNGQNLFLGTVDPMTGKDAIHYAVKGQEYETRLRIFHRRGR